jgi:hypothetical protein
MLQVSHDRGDFVLAELRQPFAIMVIEPSRSDEAD